MGATERRKEDEGLAAKQGEICLFYRKDEEEMSEVVGHLRGRTRNSWGCPSGWKAWRVRNGARSAHVRGSPVGGREARHRQVRNRVNARVSGATALGG